MYSSLGRKQDNADSFCSIHASCTVIFAGSKILQKDMAIAMHYVVILAGSKILQTVLAVAMHHYNDLGRPGSKILQTVLAVVMYHVQ